MSLVRSSPAIQSVAGFVFAERFAGTNGIGLALAERQLISVYGAEHFAERSQANACVGIPVRDPLSGRIEGVLCFGYPPVDARRPRWTSVIARRLGPSNGGCWRRVRRVSALCCGRTWPPEPKPPTARDRGIAVRRTGP